MKLQKNVLTAIFVPILCSVLCLCAFANTIHLDKKGSVSINMMSEGDAIGGGEITLYRVGDLSLTDGEYSFILTDEFKNPNIMLEDINSKDTAKDFLTFAIDNKIKGITSTIDGDGKADFDELSLGLYLLTQSKAADGYEEFEPFLITVPLNNNGEYVYDVDASPKIDIEREESEPESAPPDIPQTGMLKWPIPVLAICGIIIFSIGWSLCFLRKR